MSTHKKYRIVTALANLPTSSESDGDFYFVRENSGWYVWDQNANQMKQTGSGVSGTIDISDVDGLQTALNSIDSDITTEQTARSGADITLNNAITTEATARAGADVTLASSINGVASDLLDVSDDLATEETARASADTTLNNAITTEATARANADTAIAATVTTEATARANADTAIAATVTTEATARANADTAIAATVTTEATARAAADTTLTTAVAAKATIDSPALTGTPTAPTAAAATNTTQLATCAFVESEIPLRSAVLSVAGRSGAIVLAESDITGLVADLALKAPLASPTLTTPTISGVLTMNGATSGSATLTAPAIAATIANPFLLSNSLQLPSATGIGFNGDVGISRASAGSLNLGNGTPGNTTGTLILQTITASGSITTGAATSFICSGRSKINSSADGLLTVQNNAGSGFTGLNLGGNTTSFPRLSRSGTAVIQTLGDGTAGGSFGAGGMTPVGIGTPTQIYNTPATAQTASIAATTMFTVGAADANFIAHFYLGQLNSGTGCVGAGSVGINVTFTDPITGNAYTVVIPIKSSGGTGFQTALPLTNGSPAVANTGSAEFRIRAKAATAIQFSTSYASGASCSQGQAYNIYPDLEAL